jgi:hypothetical protein
MHYKDSIGVMSPSDFFGITEPNDVNPCQPNTLLIGITRVWNFTLEQRDFLEQGKRQDNKLFVGRDVNYSLFVAVDDA